MGADKTVTDPDLRQIEQVLREGYGLSHPDALIDVRRQNSVAIRIRIIDDAFAGEDFAEREQQIWPLLERLPDEVFEQITMVLLLTHDEKAQSMASMEFDHPVPSML